MTLWDFLFNPVTIGFVIGGLTNSIAIKMIFRPYRKIGLSGIEWQGLIPKRQPELAIKIASVITTRLLTRDKIVARFADPEVRSSIEQMIREMLDHFLEQDLGALSQYLSPSEKTRLAETVSAALGRLGKAIEEWLATEAGHSFVAGLLDQALARCPDEILQHLNVDLEGQIRAYFDEFLKQNDLRSAIKQGISRLVVDWANSARTIGDSISPETREVLESEITSLAPILQDRIGQALFSSENLEKMRQAVRAGVEKELNKPVKDPGSFAGIIEMGARAVFKQPILERVDAMFAANVPELKAAMADADTRGRFEKALLELLDDLLSLTPNELLSERSAESLDLLLERMTDLIEQGLHKPELREFLAGTLAEEAHRLARLPARELAVVAGMPPDISIAWANALCTNLAHGRIASFLKKEGWWLFDVLINIPIGRIARFADSEMVEQATGIALEHLLQVVSEKAPQVLEAVDMEGIVRAELLNYPPEELEKLVQSISARELRAITWLGGVLGALIGAIQLLL